MKFLLSFFCFFLIACSQNTTQPVINERSKEILTFQGYGDVRVGMSLKELISLGKNDRFKIEDVNNDCPTIFDNHNSLYIFFLKGKLYSISLTNSLESKLATLHNIKIGDPYNKILKTPNIYGIEAPNITEPSITTYSGIVYNDAKSHQMTYEVYDISDSKLTSISLSNTNPDDRKAFYLCYTGNEDYP